MTRPCSAARLQPPARAQFSRDDQWEQDGLGGPFPQPGRGGGPARPTSLHGTTDPNSSCRHFFLLRVFQSLVLCECLFVSRRWHQHGLFPACSSSSPTAEVTDAEQGTGSELVLTGASERREGSWWSFLPLLGKKTCQVNGDPLKEQHSVPQAMTSIQRKRARTRATGCSSHLSIYNMNNVILFS